MTPGPSGLSTRMHIDDTYKLEIIVHIKQRRSQDFLKGGSSTSIELLEAGVWGRSPQPLGDF